MNVDKSLEAREASSTQQKIMAGGVAAERLLQSNPEEELPLSTRVWVESKKLWRVGGPAILIRLSSFGILVVAQSFTGYDGETELAAYALVFALFVRFANGFLVCFPSIAIAKMLSAEL